MSITLTVNATTYELQKATGSAPIAHLRLKKFHDRPSTEQFVSKLLTENHEQQSAIKNLLEIVSKDDSDISSELVQGLLNQSLHIVRDNTASGGSASRPPTAQAIPVTPKPTDAIDGSTILSMAMKSYLKQHAHQPLNTNLEPTKGKPALSDSKDYEAVVEIAGTHLSKKQSLQITTKDGKKIKKYASNDHRNLHRSLCTFSYLNNAPVSLSLSIPMKGMSHPMLLPLHDAMGVYGKGTQKQVWDNLIIPIKPMQFLSDEQQKKQSDILQSGWLYVYWNGRLWRELKVSKNGVLQDVNLEHFRQSNQDEREAEGHWLDAVWVPYLLNGIAQNNIQFAASVNQWSWSTIKQFESDASQFSDKQASLDALSAYTNDSQFNEAALQSGAILTATVVPENSQAMLHRQQRQQIATAYLPKVGAKLKIKLTDQEGKPWSHAKVVATLNGRSTDLTADSEGFIALDVPTDANTGELDISVSPQTPSQNFHAKLNQLDTVESIAGLQARLNNLGYNAGPVDGILGRKTKSATRKFQTQHKLMVDGISGPQTQSKLTAIHQS
ncbi:MAG: peptidoglycan-binding protein [Pseudomonadales bacterium]|nr:peptidoglycan-binding protein [Pseudomonadales bacterium]